MKKDEGDGAMNLTYEREVGHCKPNKNIKMVTIKIVEPAHNSDFLDRLEFEEIGWQTIGQRGLYKEGQKVLFIPPESVLPFELTEKLGITKHTSKGRIRMTTLRGNRSEGFVIDPEKVDGYIPYILKWEDPPTMAMSGDAIPRQDIPMEFYKFYDMPNILNEPFTFKVGEILWYSEKVHGTNMRFARMKHPELGDYRNYVGSHEIVLKESEDNLYWRIFNEQFRDRIPADLEFFAEVFGKSVQHLEYGRKDQLGIVFAITSRGLYLNPQEVTEICRKHKLPVVRFRSTTFTNLESIRELANEPSEYTDLHHREGVVMVSDEFPNRMAKSIGSVYFEENQKKHNKRTERH